MGHVIGLGHSDSGVMAAELQAGERTTPEMWGRRVAAEPPRAAGHGAPSPIRIDWAAGAPDPDAPVAAVRDDRRPQAAAAKAVASKPADAAVNWQQRFVSHLGASAERMQPNAALRLHLPTVAGTSPRLGRL